MRRRTLRRGVLHRNDKIRPAQPVFGQQSLFGPLRQGIPRHVRNAHPRHQLLEQLRAVPVPRKADPAVHQQHPAQQATARIR